MAATDLSAFTQRMSAHIRKEERQLFERMQELMNLENWRFWDKTRRSAQRRCAGLCAARGATGFSGEMSRTL